MYPSVSNSSPSGTGRPTRRAPARMGLRPKSVNDASGCVTGVSWAGSWQPGGMLTKDDLDMDPVRRRILARVKESRSNLRMASRAIGRNAAYLHQFIHRGTPRVLAENDREALAEHLGCSPKSCGTIGLLDVLGVNQERLRLNVCGFEGLAAKVPSRSRSLPGPGSRGAIRPAPAVRCAGC